MASPTLPFPATCGALPPAERMNTLFGNAQGLSQFPNVGVHLFDGGRYARQRHDVNFLRPQLIQHDLRASILPGDKAVRMQR